MLVNERRRCGGYNTLITQCCDQGEGNVYNSLITRCCDQGRGKHRFFAAFCPDFALKIKMRLSIRSVYVFTYNLFQFCGHTWLLANMTARILSFGRGALADTFYAVGVVMTLCQLLSVLELFHIADEIEQSRLLPRLVQVVERNLLLFLVIISLEDLQSSPVVTVQFMLWNILDLLRYPHQLLSVMGMPSFDLLWARYTLWIPLYAVSVITEGITVYQALPYLEPSSSTYTQLTLHVPPRFPLHLVLKIYLPILAVGACVTVYQLWQERRQQLDKWNKKQKRK